jgi:hypothetical protein
VSLPQPTAGGAPSLRRGVLAACLVLAVAPLSACAAGNDAASLQIRPDNAATTVGDIEIQNAVVIVAEGANAPASVSATVFNNGTEDQTLDAIALDGNYTFKLGTAGGKGGGPVTVPAGGQVLLGGKGNASATINDFASADNVELGDYAKVTFRLSETGDVALNAHVVPAEGYYGAYAPTPQADASTLPVNPSQSAAAEEGKPSAAPAPGASESPAAEASGEARHSPASPNATSGPTESAPAGH